MSSEIGSLARALLDATKEPHPACSKAALLSAFDWEAHGVTQPYAIFMTGRCGSTWLTSLIKSTGLAGNPEEFFNGDVATYALDPSQSGLQSYFSHVVRKEASNGRFGLEIDGVRLNQLDGLVDWIKLFPPNGAKTFFLYRRDILAQAWSWLSAMKTGIWHVQHGKEIKGGGGKHFELDDLAGEIVRIRRSEEYLARFFDACGYKPYYLDYESLSVDPATQLAVILRILGINDEHLAGLDIDKKMSLSKINYTDKHHRLAEFSDRHQDALTAIQKDRLGLGSAEISRMLAVE